MAEGKRPDRLAPATRCLLLAAALLCLALFAYRSTFSTFFTGRDAISFVADGRVAHWKDILSLFARKQFEGTTFKGSFYRPVTSLSFAPDYAVWRLNPTGYHLSDVLIHGLVAILAFVLGRKVMGLGNLWAFAGAALFVLHPTHQGTVPVIARRIDPTATLFAFAALALFVEAGSAIPLRAGRWGSWVAYALGLLSKETAIVALPVIALLALRSVKARSFAQRAAALRSLLPFAGITLAYLILRTSVLGGLGGYPDKSPLTLNLKKFYQLVHLYVTLLANPFGYQVPAGWGLDVLGMAGLAFFVALACLSVRFLHGSVISYAAPLLWIASQLALLLAAQTLTTQHAYAPLAWLCMLAARSCQDCLSMALKPRARALLKVAGGAGFACCLAATATLAAFSPIVRGYPAWRTVGESQRRFLVALEARLEPLPEHTPVLLTNLPFLIPEEPREREIEYLAWLGDYGIRDWLTLRFPDRQWDLEMRFNKTSRAPVDFDLVEIRSDQGALHLHMVYDRD